MIELLKKIFPARRRLRLRPAPLLAAPLLLAAACASIGNPSGGPRDEEPPRPVRSNPAPYSVNFSGKRVTIDFDELVNVKDAFSKVTVSPTSKETPRVSSSGRRVTVQFADSLLPNTTYSIDFGNSIEDNNEGNKIDNFNLTFSTGPEVDSLRISGVVLNAADLEPRQEMLVGIHSNLSDSAFRKLPLERITKTDDRGRFSIRGLKPGKYRVYALGDLNNDFRWDNPEEDLAFYDVVVSPSAKQATTVDSIYNELTHQIDTVVERQYTSFLPNDILLSVYNTNYKPQYLVDYARPDSARLTMRFNARSASLPAMTVVGAERMKDWYVAERSRYNDTITYWLKPKSLVVSDTLRIAARYQRTDTAQRLQWISDTLRFITPKVKLPKKSKKELEADTLPKINFLDMKVLAGSVHEVYAPLTIEFGTPLDTLFSDRLRLFEKIDTVYVPVAPGKMTVSPPDSLNPRRYRIEYPWEYGKGYKFSADTIAAVGIYSTFTRPQEVEFKIKKEEEYARLRFMVSGVPAGMSAFVQLLNSGDSPQRSEPVADGVAMFTDLAPGDYYVRLVEDRNGNGEFDPGDFDAGVQPEAVFYFPKKLKIKKGWTYNQDWNIDVIPVDLQKPAELRKAKYEDEKRRRNRNANTGVDEEEDDYFDPTANPFDPNQKKRRRNNPTGYSY